MAKITFDPNSHTSFGVASTIFNLEKGIMKSYYEEFYCCELISDKKYYWHKVTENKGFLERLNIKMISLDSTIYVMFSKSYSQHPILFVLENNFFYIFRATRKNKRKDDDLNYTTLVNNLLVSKLEEYAVSNLDKNIYLGIALKLQKITEEEIKSKKDFVKKIDNWFVFDHNKKFYCIVNSNPIDYNISTFTFDDKFHPDKNPLYFYIDKRDKKVYDMVMDVVPNYAKPVIKELFPSKGFFNFLK